MNSSQRWQILDVDPQTLHLAWFGDFSCQAPAADAEQIASAIDRHRQSSTDWKEAELELHDCVNVDSRGLALLLFLRRHLSADIPRWRICGAPDAFARMIRMMNLQKVFQVQSKQFKSSKLLFESELPSTAWQQESAEGIEDQRGADPESEKGVATSEPVIDETEPDSFVDGTSNREGSSFQDGSQEPSFDLTVTNLDQQVREPSTVSTDTTPSPAQDVDQPAEKNQDKWADYRPSPLRDDRPG